MRRVVIALPGWSGHPDDSSLLRDLPALARLGELGTPFRLQPWLPAPTPEAAILGLDPRRVQLQPGPLMVSALNQDPPERSVHFHLSLLSWQDGIAHGVPTELPVAEVRALMAEAKRLSTAALTVLIGEGADHALVWENGSLDLGVFPPEEVDGQPIQSKLPQGDGERLLRRLIDDSLNLLAEHPINRRRVEEGLPPLNLLWPWGAGLRVPVPNLALQRGEPARVESGSLRMQGLARLSRYRHGDRAAFGKGTEVNWQRLVQAASDENALIVYHDAFAMLRQGSREEEAEWLATQVDRHLLAPLAAQLAREPMRLALVCPSFGREGLGMVVEHRAGTGNRLPFDERLFTERGVPVRQTWEVVDGLW